MNDVIDLFMLGLKLNHVGKRGLGSMLALFRRALSHNAIQIIYLKSASNILWRYQEH